MRVGTISYATSRGLGHLCRDFHRHGLIDGVMVMEHPGVPTNLDWYPGAPMTKLRGMDFGAMQEFCRGFDAMLFFETPFHWGLFSYCRMFGIKTYLITMYECTPEAHQPPDVYLCPSLLDCDYFMDRRWRTDPRVLWNRQLGRAEDSAAVWVQLPVEYPWRLRERALHYVHNGGYLGVKTRQGGVMREGTTTLIEAMQHVKSPLKLTIRVQENVPTEHQRICANDPRIDYVPENVAYETLYAEGDVCVGAQRWNGCSLPLQEAFASGMLVMNTERFPMTAWLPDDPLVPPQKYLQGSSIGGPYMKFEEAHVNPVTLAAIMDRWYDRDITYYSRLGKEWADQNSWESLLPRWRQVLGKS